MPVQIRKASEADADGILAIESVCFSLPHTRDQLLREISSKTSLILTAYDTELSNDDNDGNTNDCVCGFVTMNYVLDEGYVGDVAVAENFRRKGVADSLLKALRLQAEQLQLAFITLEVRETNLPAIALYEKNGYKKISVMKDYYTLPKENAIIMTLYLTQR